MTTETAAPELATRVREILLAAPANVRAQYASHLAACEDGSITRLYALGIIRQVRGLGLDDTATVGDLPKQRKNPTGSNAGSHRPDPASEAQVRYARRLVASKVGGSEYAAEVEKGLSKTRASAIIDILSGRPDVESAVRMATEGQVNLLNKLRAERGSEPLSADQAAALTFAQVKADIDVWMKIPRPVVAKDDGQELEAGIYRVGDKYFKVQKAVHGSGRMYAKELIVRAPGEAEFVFAAGAIRHIRPEHKMTLEEAKQFGQVYGVCCNCAAVLTDEASIAAGIGPVCAKKF
jgi:hypothetical protein